MSQQEILIRSDKHNLVVSDRLSIKSILKHLVVLSFLVIATLTLFHLDINELPKVIDDPQIAIQTFIIYFLLYVQLRNTLRMINFSNNTIYFSIVASLISIGYATYIYISFQDSHIEHLRTILWYYLPSIGLTLVWKICQIFFENKPNPVMSKALIVSSINTLAWAGLLIFIYFITDWYIFDSNKQNNFNVHSALHIWNVIACTIVGIIFITTSIYMFVYSWKHHMQSRLKMSITYAGALMLIVPFTIWFIYFSYEMKDNWESILYLCSYISLIMFAVYVAFFWKKTMGSPVIISVVYMLIITIAWVISMLTTVVDPLSDSVNYLFSKCCPLVVSAVVIILIYFKNPRIAFIGKLAFVFIISAMLYWLVELVVIEKIKEANLPKSIFEIQKDLWAMLLFVDGMAMAFPAMILAINTVQWYMVQRSIKSKSSKIKKIGSKNKVVNKDQVIKEASHA